jgi:protein gp37
MTKRQTIFVCSMADLFEWVPDLWINLVIDSCLAAPQRTYIFLTKNPKRYLTIPGQYLGQSNFWFGATVTNSYDAWQRIHWLQRMPEGNTFISFEPLLETLGPLDLHDIKQVIIGAQTNPDVYVSLEAVFNVAESADKVGASVFMKDSLTKQWPDREPRRELCWSVRK